MRPESEFGQVPISLKGVLGGRYVNALQSAHDFLRETPRDDLRSMVGQKLEFIPEFERADKRFFAMSYQKPRRYRD